MSNRPEPFRHLLEQALQDDDLTVSSLTLRSIPERRPVREDTRPDRPRFLSGELEALALDPFSDEASSELPDIDHLDLDDEDTRDDTLAEEALPTRPFDLRRLAELSQQKSESPLLAKGDAPHLDPATSMDPLPFATTSLPPLEPLSASLSDPSIPIAVGLSTKAWQVTHRDGQFSLQSLDALLEAPRPTPSPTVDPDADTGPQRPARRGASASSSRPAAPGPSRTGGRRKASDDEREEPTRSGRRSKRRRAAIIEPTPLPMEQAHPIVVDVERVLAPAGSPAWPRVPAGAGPVLTCLPDEPLADGLPLEHLDRVAGPATPAPGNPNHRQRNMAQDLYLSALKALAAGDKKSALTHLRTAAALDPTVERYRMMISDLSGRPTQRPRPVELPVVRGVLLE